MGAPTEEPRFRPDIVRPAPWALVLSSGTVRGFAHIGVLRELEHAGLRPDLIVGTSAGAIVGAVSASGVSAKDLAIAAGQMKQSLFGDWIVPRIGLLGGRGIHGFVDTNARAHRIEEFPVRFAAVAVEAERGCLQIFNAGDAGKAVQASSTVPVFLVPPEIGGKKYLDGGLTSPLPVRVARLLGAQRVVAVDVTFDPAERPFRSISDAFWRSTLVMQRALAILEGMEADVLVSPRLPREREISFANREAIVESGALAARDAVPAIRRMLASRLPDQGAKSLPPQLLCSVPER